MPIAHTIFFLVLLLVLLAVLIGLVTIGTMITYGSIVSKVPIVPVRKNAIPFIIENLKLTQNSILYDLGSGDGDVLEYALQKTSIPKAVGLEIAPWPRFISKMKLRRFGRRAHIKNQNFFKADFSDATHIYVYLLPAVLDKLKPIFDRTLKPGTRVVSCDFQFTDKKPEEILPVPNAKILAKTLYIYTW